MEKGKQQGHVKDGVDQGGSPGGHKSQGGRSDESKEGRKRDKEGVMEAENDIVGNSTNEETKRIRMPKENCGQ